VFALALAGCSLTSRSAPIQIRYFAIETPRDHARTQLAARCELELQLGRIEPDIYLREKIAHRVSPAEVQLYDTKRWTETPDVYVRRALEHALFERRPFHQVLGGRSPTLDVEVIAFEELQTTPPRGRVELRYRLHDNRTVLANDVVAVERVAGGADFSYVIDAIADALDAAANKIAEAAGKIGCR
jgi:cholesterol transport system auxiliary component